MFLDSKDYQPVWVLAHDWVGADSEQNDAASLSPELKEAINRLLIAAINLRISIRTARRRFFVDDSTISTLMDFQHLRRFWKCTRHDQFDKDYLCSIYVNRGEVLRWCQDEFLAPPPMWRVEQSKQSEPENDDEKGWYESLTEKRRQRVACLEMAKILWKQAPNTTYEEMYRHTIMQRYCVPTVFTLRAFKKWSQPYASDYAKRIRSDGNSDS